LAEQDTAAAMHHQEYTFELDRFSLAEFDGQDGNRAERVGTAYRI
jgi:hypothetical protein